MFWEKSGRENTAGTVEEAVKAALKKGIKYLVVASNTGETAEKVLGQQGVEELNLVCVTHHVGFKEPGQDEMSKEMREKLVKAGVSLYTGTHALAGVDRSLKNNFGGIYPPEIIAYTLRMFGQGTKVCVEVALMALDAGLIPCGEDVMAVGGTGRGADTAAVIRPAHSNDIFKTRVVELICRPELT